MLFQSKEIMTDEQRDIIIAKMIDAHSTLTDEELDLIANDIELSDIQELSAAVRGAYVPKPEINVDDEWSRFKKSIQRKPSHKRWLIRVAAILIGVALIYGIMVIMINQKATLESPEMIANSNLPHESTITSLPDDEMTDKKITANAPQHSVHRMNSKKSSIISETQHRTDEVPDTTTIELQEEIDLDEYLIIQQAIIDNDIAMQNAEILLDEYAAIQQIFDSIGEDGSLIETTIQKVTMQ